MLYFNQRLTPAPPTVKRWFYRCSDCLSVAAAESIDADPSLKCDCGGSMRSLGHVRRFRVVNVELHTPCDGRCTNAHGPSCGCACGGENHGSQALVEVVRDAGGIPTLKAGNMERATEYRAARDAAVARIAKRHAYAIDAKARGEFIREGYWEWRGDSEALAHARALKSHKGRLKALAEVCK